MISKYSFTVFCGSEKVRFIEGNEIKLTQVAFLSLFFNILNFNVDYKYPI